MSYKPEVKVNGEFCTNMLVFASYEEALTYAKDLYNRWFACDDYRAVESEDTVNCKIENNALVHLEENYVPA